MTNTVCRCSLCLLETRLSCSNDGSSEQFTLHMLQLGITAIIGQVSGADKALVTPQCFDSVLEGAEEGKVSLMQHNLLCLDPKASLDSLKSSWFP